MGGGLATTARDDRGKALVDQMGPVNYAYNVRELTVDTIRDLETKRARGELSPFPGPGGLLNPALKGFPDWAVFKRFNPIAEADKLSAATLIIDAEAETLLETEKNGKLLYQRIKDRLDARYMTWPGGHYDMYKGENHRLSIEAASQWFGKYLQ